MPETVIARDRVDGWAKIANHLGCDVTTAIRWAKSGRLPVHQPSGRRGAVHAYRQELDHWLKNGRFGVTEPDLQSRIGAAITNATPQSSERVRTPFRQRIRTIRLVAMGVTTVLAALSIFSILWLDSRKQFLLAGETQITDDNTQKKGIVTDGSNLYFGEWRDGHLVLSVASIHGGPVRQISTPFVQAEPVAISKDGRQILILAGVGMESERALWMVPTRGGVPQRVGNILCHSAAWSPDGKKIAFAYGTAIFLTSDSGATQQEVQAFAGIPDHLHWSIDGKRILFLRRDIATWEGTVWEVALDTSDHFSVATVIPLSRTPAEFGAISPVINGEDDVFASTVEENSKIFALAKSRWPWKTDFRLTSFSSEPGGSDDFAVDPGKQQLYWLRGLRDQNELSWFDKNSHQSHPFLPGASAIDVDFSRDGRRIVYVHEPDETIWIANSDGSSAMQIATPSLIQIELPRWSPDGKKIAFMAKRADSPWRIFVTSSVGGNLYGASHGTDSQGAPTWSPDGGHLIYGRVECQEVQTCAIGEIDLKTGRQTVVEGSEGLSTARWSPDGRYIAALNADKHQVFLLDRRTRQWRKLADGINGNDLAWAPDSKSIYASKPGGDRPEVVRISLSEDKIEPAVDLTSFSKLFGRIGTWFAVTPDDSIVVLRNVGGNEVYALHYAER